tara:strand:- start:2945 stop:4249 length:1305 start_codon:yes stop_codon:yes gene_type:complete
MAVTITFSEDVRGWVSFKSFLPENGLTMNNHYYTMKDGRLWMHGSSESVRNTFYDEPPHNSWIDVLVNGDPSTIKSFRALSYEGTQAKIDKFDTVIAQALGTSTGTYGDGQYYNLNDKKGWYTEYIRTDKQEGNINEFIEKEGKWFNYIKGEETNLGNLDTEEFSVQGIGSEWDLSLAPGSTSQYLYTLRDVGDIGHLTIEYTGVYPPQLLQITTDDVSYTTTVHQEDVDPGIVHGGNSGFSNLRTDSFTIHPTTGYNITAADFYAIYVDYNAFPNTVSPQPTITHSITGALWAGTNSSMISPHGEVYTAPSMTTGQGISEKQMATAPWFGGNENLYPEIKSIGFIEIYDVNTPTQGYRYPYPDRIKVEVLYSNIIYGRTTAANIPGPYLSGGWVMPNANFEILVDIKRHHDRPLRPIGSRIDWNNGGYILTTI